MSSDEGGPSKKAREEQATDSGQFFNKYMYETLFKQQAGSDITIVVLEKKWKLHKIIIKQCPYFASMFSGNWKESEAEVIHVNVEGSDITIDSLEVVFGSMYGGNVSLTSDNVVSILATASLFQIEELIDRCSKTMIHSIDDKNVISYLKASTTYGLTDVKANTIQWLELNLVSIAVKGDYSFMQDISVELMKDLVSSQTFFVFKNECSIYQMLRKWLYLHLRQPNIELEEFYTNRTWQTPLLLTKEGEPFISPFETLRSIHLLNTVNNIQNIERDNVLPQDWIQTAYKNFWQHSLEIGSNVDKGPTNVTPEVFEKLCMRSRFVIPNLQNYRCYFRHSIFGLDFEFVFCKNDLKITRRQKENNGFRIFVPDAKRNILLKVFLIAYDEKGSSNSKIVQSSGLLAFSLALNEEQHIMDCDKEISLPLKMMVKILTVTPKSPH